MGRALRAKSATGCAFAGRPENPSADLRGGFGGRPRKVRQIRLPFLRAKPRGAGFGQLVEDRGGWKRVEIFNTAEILGHRFELVCHEAAHPRLGFPPLFEVAGGNREPIGKQRYGACGCRCGSSAAERVPLRHPFTELKHYLYPEAVQGGPRPSAGVQKPLSSFRQDASLWSW